MHIEVDLKPRVLVLSNFAEAESPTERRLAGVELVAGCGLAGRVLNVGGEVEVAANGVILQRHDLGNVLELLHPHLV